MILRVYRARAAAEDRGLLLAHLRDDVYPANVGTPGLRTFQAGVGEVPDGSLEVALVSTWADFNALLDGLGGDSMRPRWLHALRDRLTPVAADHYELIGEELRGIVPLAGGALRVFRGRLKERGGEEFFQFARQSQAQQLDSGEILVSHIGRRIDEGAEEAAYVVVWRDAEAARAQGGSSSQPANQGAWSAFFEEWSFSAYEAIARVPGKPGSDQALLLADDDRHYVFASPGAGELLGRSPARLLGRRVDEMAASGLRAEVPARWQAFLRAGSEAATFELERADGTTVAVRYEARTNTPWPGVHASVLRRADAPIDFDAALAASGIVARYQPDDAPAG